MGDFNNASAVLVYGGTESRLAVAALAKAAAGS